MPLRFAIQVLLLLMAAPLVGQQPSPSPAPAPPNPIQGPAKPLVIEGLGKGLAPIDGTWQFQIGDDLNWSSPTLDDSSWEQIHTEDPWGMQNHPSYAGFAWYRRHVEIQPTAGAESGYRILIPRAEDAYEVYWNGVLMGSYGKLPPHPFWYYNQYPRSFPLIGSGNGVLAIRVWKAPLEAFSAAETGGLDEPPLVGSPEDINVHEYNLMSSFVREDLFDYSLVLLRCFIALLSVVLWTRNRGERLFIWVAILTATPVALEVLQRLFLIPFTYGAGRLLNQPIYAIYHISLWFLLIWLLRLNSHPRLVRTTRVLAAFTMIAALIDGGLAFFWGTAGTGMQWADGILTALILLAEVYPFVLVGIGLRKWLGPSRWVVAITALVLQMINTVGDASALGQRFTHWTLFADLIDHPLFAIQGVGFRVEKIISIALFLSILYAVYRYALEQQARQSDLERELQSAREIQQVLIPETLPSIKGYAVTSAYHPAQEVGGDFFQIIPNPDGTTFIALGDVSGKGLKAAMNVSMIVGVLRAAADESSGPATVLERLNYCLHGRMQGGFTTAVVMLLGLDGSLTLANAGHLPPFLNHKEVEIGGSLPLGLIPMAQYDEVTIPLEPGDRFTLYTDGLLEARNNEGELYGFERLHALLATRPTAVQATQAAIAFGQDDDITVLTLTRLGAGEQSTTSVTSPFLTTTPSVR